MAVAAHTSDTARLEAFSDGVFAIAITLLVLEIHVPAPDATQHGRTLLTALRQLWPSYLGYALSFVTIGIMWANHHSIFRYVRRADRYFLLINVLFLMWISFLPFPTALLAAYLPEPEGRTLAVAGYSATLVMIAVAYNAVWWYRSEEHTSELQSQSNLVCRLLLEKKKKNRETTSRARTTREPQKTSTISVSPPQAATHGER